MTGEKSGEFRGKSVEAALAAGLAALRLNRDDVEVEVIRPGSRGVLGIGAEDAIVRLTAVRRSGASEARPAPADRVGRASAEPATRSQTGAEGEPARQDRGAQGCAQHGARCQRCDGTKRCND